MNRHQQEAKKYLSQAFGLNQRIESKLGQIEDLHDLATKATVTYSDMPKSPNRDGSRMEDAIIKIIDLENEINQDMMKLVELKKDIIRRIKAVESAELQTILELRYLSYMRWEEIAIELGYVFAEIQRIYRHMGKSAIFYCRYAVRYDEAFDNAGSHAEHASGQGFQTVCQFYGTGMLGRKVHDGVVGSAVKHVRLAVHIRVVCANAQRLKLAHILKQSGILQIDARAERDGDHIRAAGKRRTVQNAYAVGKVDTCKRTVCKGVFTNCRDGIGNDNRLRLFVGKGIFPDDHNAVGNSRCVYGRGDKAVIRKVYQTSVNYVIFLVAFRNGYHFQRGGKACGKRSRFGIGCRQIDGFNGGIIAVEHRTRQEFDRVGKRHRFQGAQR